MISYGWLLAGIGMAGVFSFLVLLMWVIQFFSFVIRKLEARQSDLSKVALAIAVGLKGEK